MRFWLIGLLSVVFSVPVQARELYVAPNGNGEGTGSETQPFATLTQARDAIRALKASGKLNEPVTVLIKGGTYFLDRTLVLEAEDAGTPAAPITYRGFENEHPVLIGGRRIEGFATYRDSIVQADVGAQGLRDTRFRMLIVDGERQELARYPNRHAGKSDTSQWAYVAGQRFSMYADSPDEDGYHAQHRELDGWQRNIPRLTRTLTVQTEDIHPWSRLEQGEVSIFPRHAWTHYLLRIESFDGTSGQLHLAPGSYYEIRPGDRYFLRNLKEELDCPGEWYLDDQAAILYFWPEEPLEGKTVYAPVLQHLVELRSCEHVSIEGLRLECCEGTAVVLDDAASCRIAGCSIYNVGGYEGDGVVVRGGRKNGVVGCDIYDVGACGIRLGGGDVASLTLGENYADNNYIHHVGVVGLSATGIELTGAGNRVSHNYIHDVPQGGVRIWGSQHLVELNHIRHTNLEGQDSGGIGGGAIDWLGWLGTEIRYNYIHDTIGFGYDEAKGKWVSPYFTSALYPDWAASGVTMVGNVLVRAPLACLLVHSGRDNVIENNILVDGGQTQVYWRGWTTAEGFWSTMVNGWINKYEEAVQHAAWRDVAALKDPRAVPLPDQRVMTGNSFRRNIIYYTNPAADLYWMDRVPLQHNSFDFNVVYHAGQPLRTGVLVAKEEIGPNLTPNSGLEDGTVGKLPPGWGVFSGDGTTATVVNDQAHEGVCSLWIRPAEADEGDKVVRTSYLMLGSTTFQPGKSYRLSAWMKGAEEVTPVELCVYSWKKDEHNWSVQSTATVTPQWRKYDLVFRLPKEGERDYRPTMDSLWWRVQVPRGSGEFWIDDVSWNEVELADQWDAWRTLGMDRHSLAADPKFVDPERDDYRLQEDSPALQLGFVPIPFEQIGPYPDPLRASWPIEEAPGVREQGTK